MPPQPLSKVKHNANVAFEPAALLEVPHLTVFPMMAIAHWAVAESTLAKLLIRFLGADRSIGLAMYNALTSGEAKRAALLGAAKATASDDDNNLLAAVMKVAKHSRDRRNDFAHHLWGTLRNPEALALLDPKYALEDAAAWAEYADQMEAFSDIATSPTMAGKPLPPPPPSPKADRSKILVYRQADLEEVAQEAAHARWNIQQLSSALDPTSPLAAHTRKLLLDQPPIQSALQKTLRDSDP